MEAQHTTWENDVFNTTSKQKLGAYLRTAARTTHKNYEVLGGHFISVNLFATTAMTKLTSHKNLAEVSRSESLDIHNTTRKAISQCSPERIWRCESSMPLSLPETTPQLYKLIPVLARINFHKADFFFFLIQYNFIHYTDAREENREWTNERNLYLRTSATKGKESVKYMT